MDRRQFLRAAVAPLALPIGSAVAPDQAIDDLKKHTIIRVVGFKHTARRPHVAGKNAWLGVHGDVATEDVLRIATDVGVEGIGAGSTSPDLARMLLGRTLDTFWKPRIGVVSPIGRADHALYDLVGKALAEPSWKILGGMGPERVPVYDGSVYFNDLLPESGGRSGVNRLLHEVEQSLESGHRAFKIKVGRGFKWMTRAAGLARDAEVVHAVRRLVGPNVNLMVDANNAFDLEGAERWLDLVGGANLLFVEEMFPEQPEHDLALKAYLREKGYATLVADGESARDLDDFDALVKREALDVFQPDIRAFGLTRQAALARKLSVKPALKLAPHNWGSFLGLYM
jgi:D-galactarolactone cycloisomerase